MFSSLFATITLADAGGLAACAAGRYRRRGLTVSMCPRYRALRYWIAECDMNLLRSSRRVPSPWGKGHKWEGALRRLLQHPVINWCALIHLHLSAFTWRPRPWRMGPPHGHAPVDPPHSAIAVAAAVSSDPTDDGNYVLTPDLVN